MKSNGFMRLRFLYIIVLVFIGLFAQAQRLLVRNMTTFDDKLIHFGFTLGLNTTDFNITHYNLLIDNPKFLAETVNGIALTGNEKIRADIQSLTPGFTVGIVTNLRLSESLDLRFLPGMSFGERKLVYNIPIQDVNDVSNKDFFSIKSTFLDFPLLIKYKSRRMNNERPYILGGMAYRIDISKTGQEDLVRLIPYNSYLEVGMGWDTYLQFFRLSTELKFSFGLENLIDDGPKNTQPQVYTNAISKITSNMFTLSFHFE